jgi:hypothetical protein
MVEYKSPRVWPVASALPWFIRYIYCCNLQFLNNIIINKTNVVLYQANMTLVDVGCPVYVIFALKRI